MIQGWLSKNEEKLLAHFAAKSNGIIVEIGSFQGKSTVAMAKVTKNKIYAIDPHYLKSYQKFLANTKKYKNIISIKKTSEEANKNWPARNASHSNAGGRQKISLLHIDGAHEYKFALQDLKLWLPYLKKDSVVICHDAFCPFPEVFRAIKEEIFTKDSYCYIAASDSQILAVKGKPKNVWQKINVARQKFFLTLASGIWHNNFLPGKLRFFLVNRFLKIFFLNKYMLLGIFNAL